MKSDKIFNATGRGGSHKQINIKLPGMPLMLASIKNRNISVHEGVRITKLTVKGYKGQHRLKRVTIDGMTGWEAWSVPENSVTYIFNGEDDYDGNKRIIAKLWSNGIMTFGKRDREKYSATGWSIATAMRFAFIKTQKPKE